jgi:hypothetical protein
MSFFAHDTFKRCLRVGFLRAFLSWHLLKAMNLFDDDVDDLMEIVPRAEPFFELYEGQHNDVYKTAPPAEPPAEIPKVKMNDVSDPRRQKMLEKIRAQMRKK